MSSQDSDMTTDTEPPLALGDYSFIKENMGIPQLSQELRDIRNYGKIHPDIISPQRRESGKLQMTCQRLAAYIPPVLQPFGQNKRGSYGLELKFEVENKRAPKSCPWTFSSQLNKLYCRKEAPVQFTFYSQIPLPECSKLKAFLTFKEECHKDEVVKRCPYHLAEDETAGNKKFSVIQDCTRNSRYSKCNISDRLFIDGVDWRRTSELASQCNLKMVCVSSCHGGINRRDITLVFLLYINDKCEGECRIDIKCSASPGRCREKDELKMDKKNDIETKIPKRKKLALQPEQNIMKVPLLSHVKKTVIITEKNNPSRKKPRRDSVIVQAGSPTSSMVLQVNNQLQPFTIHDFQKLQDDLLHVTSERNMYVHENTNLKERVNMYIHENTNLKERVMQLEALLAGKILRSDELV